MENNSMATVNQNTGLSNATLSDKKAFFNLVTNAETKLSDCVNKGINLVNFMFTTGSTLDEETGELRECERVIAIDEEGDSYHSMAQGIVSSFHQLQAVFGTPDTWSEPLQITVVKKPTKRGQTYIIQVL